MIIWGYNTCGLILFLLFPLNPPFTRWLSPVKWQTAAFVKRSFHLQLMMELESQRIPPQQLYMQPKVNTLNIRHSLYQLRYSTSTHAEEHTERESVIFLWALRFQRVSEREKERERESWDLHSSHECTRYTGISARTCCGNWWKMSSMKIYTR